MVLVPLVKQSANRQASFDGLHLASTATRQATTGPVGLSPFACGDPLTMKMQGPALSKESNLGNEVCALPRLSLGG